jgi:hypothetical protein
MSVCCLEFTFLEQSAQWSVPIVRMIMNENKLHVLSLSMNQRSKKFTPFCNGIYQNSMVLQSVNYILITMYMLFFSFYQPKPIFFGGN